MGQAASATNHNSHISTTTTVGHVAVLLPRERGGGVYLLAGSTARATSNDDRSEKVVSYTTLLVQQRDNKDLIQRLPGPSMTCPRKHTMATLCQNHLWVFGGDGGDKGVLSSIEYTTVGQSTRPHSPTDWSAVPTIAPWKRMSHLKLIRLSEPRAGHAAVLVHERFLIIIGGYNQHYHAQSSVQVWDLKLLQEYGTTTNIPSQHMEGEPIPMDMICCKGPKLCQPRAHAGAVLLPNRHQIVVVGGKADHNKWHSTMESISFHPRPRSVHEVFCQVDPAMYRTETTTTTASSSASAFASWSLLSHRISIEQCTHAFALHFRPQWIVACGKAHVQLLDLSSLRESTTESSQQHIIQVPLKHARDYFYAAVLLEPRPDRAQVLMVGKARDSNTPLMEVVNLPNKKDENDQSSNTDETAAPLPPPIFPVLPDPPAPSRTFQRDWKEWMDERQSLISAYTSALHVWKETHTKKVDKKVHDCREKIARLHEEIAQIETRHRETLDLVQSKADVCFQNSDAELKSILEHMEQLLVSSRESQQNESAEGRNTNTAIAPAATTAASATSPSSSKTIASFHPPSHLCCPITRQIMKDPVIVVDDGQTYERAAIVEWWNTQEQQHRQHQASSLSSSSDEVMFTSPMTGPISSRQLVPNLLIRAQCHEWAHVYGDGRADE